MRAVRVEAFGGPETLRIAFLPEPAPAPGEVLVELRACGVNFADLAQRAGAYPGGPRPPFTPGLEGAGVVCALGAGVAFPALGARVVALQALGLQAERVALPAGACRPWPERLSFEQGAAFPVSYLTAYCALVHVARAAAGELALVQAAAGGLGGAAVRVAKRLGLRVVGTASTPTKREHVLASGADRAVAYEEAGQAVRELSGGRGADLVLDGVAGPWLARSLACLAPLGRAVVLGFSAGAPGAVDAARLLFRSQGLLGFHLSALERRPDLRAQALAQLEGWLADDSLDVPPGLALPLEGVRVAHERLAARDTIGKIVLVP